MGAAFPCGCGKQLTSLAALHQHRAAMGCETAKQRKNRKSSTRLKRIRNAKLRAEGKEIPYGRRPNDAGGMG